MLRLSALFTVVSAMVSTFDLHMEAHANVQALWQQKGEIMMEMATRTYDILGAPDQAQLQACQTAMSDFQSSANTCMPPIGTVFQPNSTDTSLEIHDIIGSYCNGTSAGGNGCDATMKTKAGALKDKCITTGVFGAMCAGRAENQTTCENDNLCEWDGVSSSCHVSGAFFGTLRTILNVVCIKNTAMTKYCVPSFFDFVNSHPQNLPDLQTALQNGCDECTLKMFATWSQIEPLKAAVNFIQVANMCLQRKGPDGTEKFCLVHWEAITAANPNPPCNNSTDSTSCTNNPSKCTWNPNNNQCGDLWTPEKLAMLCHPCTQIYAQRTVFVLNLMDKLGLPDPQPRALARFGLSVFIYSVNGVCATDLQDNFCMPQIQSQPPADSQNPCTAIGTFVKNTHCCAATFVDFNQGICNIDQVVHPQSTCQTQLDQLKVAINHCPGVTLGPTCAAIKFLMVHQAILSGVDPAWLAVAANMAALQLELKAIIAYALGIDIAYITSVELQAAASGGSGRRLLQVPDQLVTTKFTVANNGVVVGAQTGLIGGMETLGLNDMVASPGSLQGATLTGTSVQNTATISGSAIVCPAVGLLVILATLVL